MRHKRKPFSVQELTDIGISYHHGVSPKTIAHVLGTTASTVPTTVTSLRSYGARILGSYLYNRLPNRISNGNPARLAEAAVKINEAIFIPAKTETVSKAPSLFRRVASWFI